MAWMSIGSLALPQQMHRNGVGLRTELARHSVELTSGLVQSPQRHLRGDLGTLAAIESRLSRISRYDSIITQNETLFQSAQTALQKTATLGGMLAGQFLAVAFTDSTDDSYQAAGTAARATLNDMVSTLSLGVAGRSVFSGAALDRPPLIAADDLLALVVNEVATLTAADEIVTALEGFFLDPGGPFETLVYRGAGQAPGGAIDDSETAPPVPNASDPALRRHLMAAAMGALLAADSPMLNRAETRKLTLATVTLVQTNGEALTNLQARVGFSQELLEQRRQRLSQEQDSLIMARQGLIGTDPFESASRLEETRHRLETLYAITARVSRLSLLEYLR